MVNGVEESVNTRFWCIALSIELSIAAKASCWRERGKAFFVLGTVRMKILGKMFIPDCGEG